MPTSGMESRLQGAGGPFYRFLSRSGVGWLGDGYGLSKENDAVLLAMFYYEVLYRWY